MLVVRDRDRRQCALEALQTRHSLLQHSALGDERQELLRQMRAGQRPQASSAPPHRITGTNGIRAIIELP